MKSISFKKVTFVKAQKTQNSKHFLHFSRHFNSFLASWSLQSSLAMHKSQHFYKGIVLWPNLPSTTTANEHAQSDSLHFSAHLLVCIPNACMQARRQKREQRRKEEGAFTFKLIPEIFTAGNYSIPTIYFHATINLIHITITVSNVLFHII